VIHYDAINFTSVGLFTLLIFDVRQMHLLRLGPLVTIKLTYSFLSCGGDWNYNSWPFDSNSV